MQSGILFNCLCAECHSAECRGAMASFSRERKDTLCAMSVCQTSISQMTAGQKIVLQHCCFHQQKGFHEQLIYNSL
jgi:hypothetical protein